MSNPNDKNGMFMRRIHQRLEALHQHKYGYDMYPETWESFKEKYGERIKKRDSADAWSDKSLIAFMDQAKGWVEMQTVQTIPADTEERRRELLRLLQEHGEWETAWATGDGNKDDCDVARVTKRLHEIFVERGFFLNRALVQDELRQEGFRKKVIADTMQILLYTTEMIVSTGQWLFPSPNLWRFSHES